MPSMTSDAYQMLEFLSNACQMTIECLNYGV